MTRHSNALALALVCEILCGCVATPRGDKSRSADGATATIDDRVAGLLKRTPAPNGAELEALNADLVALGPDGVLAICRRLVPPGAGDDAAARYALGALALSVSRRAAARERAMVAGALADALASATNDEVKAFLIEQIGFAGGDECVEALRPLLSSERLRAPATRALQAIGTPAASSALMAALPSAQGVGRVAIIQALGSTRAAAAADAILPYAADQDRETRLAALYALANIGAPASADVLARAAQARAPYERAQAASFYLLYARRLAEAGHKTESERIGRELIQTRRASGETAIACAALGDLVSLLGARALPDLTAAMADKDKEYRAAALAFAAGIPGETATRAWIEAMRTASPEARAEAVAMLGRRGDKSAAPALRAALKDADEAVRIAAIAAVARLDGADSADDLMTVLKSGSGREVEAARTALQSLAGAKMADRLAGAFPRFSAAGRAAALDLLARRRDAERADLFLAALDDADAAVRAQALKGVREVAQARHLPVLARRLAATRDAGERQGLQDAIVAVAKRCGDTDKGVDATLGAMKQANTDGKPALLETLARLGGESAFRAVRAEADDSDAAIADAAVRALANWSDPLPCDELLRIAESSPSQTRRVLALRGYARMTASRKDLPPQAALAAYEKGLALAPDSEERKPLLAGLANVGVSGALRLALPYLDDETVRAEAALALTKIGEKTLKSAPEETREAMRKVIAAAQDDATRQAARRILEGKALPVARGKAAKPSTEEGAVLAFKPVEARYVRVNILKNSGNRAVHLVELEVFPEGAVPPAPAPRAPKTESGATPASDSVSTLAPAQAAEGVRSPPEGFAALFNGRDLTGWKGLAGKGGSPLARAKMSPEELAAAQAQADDLMRAHWKAENGVCVFDGKGRSLCTARDYGDFELLVDWMIEPGGDSGVYLRGSPQVQIWDPAKHPEGSGGLFNNKLNPSKPTVCADRPTGEWNTFHILMAGERVTVHLNGALIVDNVVLENYWDRSQPIFPTGQIELQSHGSILRFRNIFLREIPRPGEWRPLFNGRDLFGWEAVGGKPGGWGVADNALYTSGGKAGGWLSTVEQFSDYELSLEFRVPPGGNSGVFHRAPRDGNPAMRGFEVQVLDDTAEKYARLKPCQYTGSIYCMSPPARRVSKPAGEWQTMTMLLEGSRVLVTLNGTAIQDFDFARYKDDKGNARPLASKGYIGLQNHGTRIEYRNIRLLDLTAQR